MTVSISYSQAVVAIEQFDRDSFILYLSYPPPDIEFKILKWTKTNLEIASIEIVAELPNYLNVEVTMRHVFATYSAIEDIKSLLIMNGVSIIK